jgi:hypothetical protein
MKGVTQMSDFERDKDIIGYWKHNLGGSSPSKSLDKIDKIVEQAVEALALRREESISAEIIIRQACDEAMAIERKEWEYANGKQEAAIADLRRQLDELSKEIGRGA